VADFARAGVPRSVSEFDWAGVYMLTLQDGNSRFDWEGALMSAKCQATYEVVEDFVRFTYYSDAHECEGQVEDVQWRVDDEGLHFNALSVPAEEIEVFYEAKPWKKIADE
jgi:hypothetical protein